MQKREVRFRAALSSPDSPFVKLLNRNVLATSPVPVDTPPNREDPQPYRMNRKLSTTDLKELVTMYEQGETMAELARKFDCHRHTVMRQLQRAGVELRPQTLVTSELVARATTLYAADHTLEDIGQLLGLEASTIGKALKRSGLSLRPPVADRWHRT